MGPLVKKLLATLGVWAVLALVTPAAADSIVEVTTSIPMAEAESPERLQAALEEEVDRIVTEELDFTPALIGVVSARVVGDRMYVRLVLADEEARSRLEGGRDAAPGEELTI